MLAGSRRSPLFSYRSISTATTREERARPAWEEQVRALGFRIAGRDEIPHPDPPVVRRVLWVDRDE